jgi:crotonobetainyl-CoA:carnitine CoA-transferase CaiB-like acyl-CoA transferase
VNESVAGPLSGIRVIDLSQVMAGPFCTMLLADMGADVVKVEAPESGDPSRRMDPITPSGESGAFLSVNRNKRSVAIDLKTESGLDVLRQLVEEADLFVENFRPGVTRRLGVDYESLSQSNPRLVYCSISGFGQTGPYSHRGGFDLIAQGMSGLMSVTGVPGGDPVKCGIPVTDLGAGLFAVYGILVALIARGATGQGQLVDTSLFEAGLGLGIWEATEYFYTGRTPRPTGSAHRLSAPYQAFKTSDGYVTVGADGARHWPQFCEIIGQEALIDDARFRTNSERLVNLAELAALIELQTVQQTTAYWLERLEEAGVPAGRINSVPEALGDPQAEARGMVIDVVHPRAGATKALGPVVKLSATPAAVRRPAPTLGQHTDEILAELGLASAHLRSLREKRVIG